jgi:tetratricopeptide (TPR) repeat protein
VVYKEQGRHAEAEALYKRALAISEKALGPDHPEVAESLNNLAELYGAQGRYADAEPLYKRALAIREKALGPDHPEVAESLNDLAELYRAQGRYADAMPLVQITIERGRAKPSIALSVLFAAQSNGLVPAGKAQDDALNVVQRGSQSAAAAAVNKLGARLAAGWQASSAVTRTWPRRLNPSIRRSLQPSPGSRRSATPPPSSG